MSGIVGYRLSSIKDQRRCTDMICRCGDFVHGHRKSLIMMDEDDPKTKKNRLLAKDMMGAAQDRTRSHFFFSRKVTCSCLKDKCKGGKRTTKMWPLYSRCKKTREKQGSISL